MKHRIRQFVTMRRFAAVTHNPLILLVRRFFAAVLRRFAAVLESRALSMCGGCAAVAVVKPPYPYERRTSFGLVRARYEGTKRRDFKRPIHGHGEVPFQWLPVKWMQALSVLGHAAENGFANSCDMQSLD
jgi:hypothetical protein